MPEPQRVRTIVGIGEALLRLGPCSTERLDRARTLKVDVGGAELNTLVLLRSLGWKARWVSRLSNNPLGRLTLSHVRREGITPWVTWSEKRHGLYFLEAAAPPRSSEVVYDRAGSAASELGPEHVDVNRVLQEADVLHCSGITMGIGSGPRALVTDSFRRAHETGVVTSFDVNYRSKMWSEREAGNAVRTLLGDVDVLFASAYDLVDLLGLGDEPAAAAREVRDRHGCAVVVVPERSRASDGMETIRVRAFAADDYCSEPVAVRPTDPIGVGDAIAGGFLSGWLVGDPELAVRRAAVAGAMKATVAGDALAATVEEIDRSTADRHRVRR